MRFLLPCYPAVRAGVRVCGACGCAGVRVRVRVRVCGLMLVYRVYPMPPPASPPPPTGSLQQEIIHNATVPGDILTDLQRAGRIPDPYYNTSWLDPTLISAWNNGRSKSRKPLLPRICSRTLMDCVAPPPPPHTHLNPPAASRDGSLRPSSYADRALY